MKDFQRKKDLGLTDIELESLDSLLNNDEKQKTIIELVAPYVVKWKWFVLSVLIALVVAFIYLRYAEKVYQVSSSVILKDQNDTRIRGGNAIFSSMDMLGTVNNVDNEVEVMRSKSLVESTINRLNLHTSYIKRGRIKSTDMYKESPLMVSMNQEDLDKLLEPITITAVIAKDQSVTLTETVEDKTKTKTTKLSKLPALYATPYGNLTFSFRVGVVPEYDSPIEIVVRRPASVVPSFRSALSVAPTSKTTSILDLKLMSSEPRKGVDFLTTLVNIYNEDAIANKNREALNTKIFIDERIALIDKELGDAERKVEEYKKSQGLTDIQSNVKLSLEKGSQYEQKLIEVNTQLNLVEYLNQYIGEAGNKNKLVPSNVGINDPTLTATINEYNKTVLERERLLRTNTESNPMVQKVDAQVAALRDAIGTAIVSVKQGLNIARRDAQNQVNLYRSQTGMAPTQERQFTEIDREKQIKASLFLMLLQKREENALALSASVNSAKVLDKATVYGLVKPRRTLVLMVAFLLGILIPGIIIFISDSLQFKISSRSDVDRLSKIPVLGEVPVSKTGNIAVKEGQNAETDEAFRMLRTNLQFMLGKDNQVILVTSTQPKEGKTFISINMAISLALLGKKVMLMGMDLRIPRMSEYLEVDSSKGMSEYLSGYYDIEDIIQPLGISPNLSVITSGSVPPNPAELIARKEFDIAIEKLKEKYDYIVIDSAPVSSVTDTVVAARVGHATMYVCRANYSHKNNLLFANELYEKKMLPNMGLVVNNVTNYHFGYGFGYGKKSVYGYGYGKSKSKSFFKKLFNLKKK
ncbi:MAG TPA: polysaccharide biosynthesis tyrosine autokinase [Bacteroidales bacterium]|nr:polysaccharide biosynthesis tyrosine autokinase [Bacteroidales bacterium]